MKRVLFVTTVDITLEAFLLPFAGHLRAAGWHVDALANGATANEHIAEHFDARFDIGWTRSPLSSGSLTAARRVREVAAEGHYDVVWAHTPIAAWMTRFALRKPVATAGVPVVYTVHGFHFYRGQDALRHAVFRTMERVAAPWTAQLVAINAEDFEAAAQLGLPPDRVRHIPGIGVDTQSFSPANATPEQVARVRAELGVDTDAVMVTMIAEFNGNKRHRLALDALVRTASGRVVLVLVGNGPLEDTVRAHARDLGVQDRVVFAGFRRDVAEVLAASDALLLCSEREGLNRSVLEAMASGIPVIGTATRGIADAIGDDEAGWVVPKDDQVALAAAIDAAAADPAERARRGAAARQRAASSYSVEQVIARYEALFAEVLATTGGRTG